MKLYPNSFEMIKNKIKTVEMRLNDEKRQSIKIGDVIIFQNNETLEKLYTKVEKLHNYKSFEELYANFSKDKLGYKEDEEANHEDMLKYYSEEQIKKYGVLGIEISLFDSDRSYRIYNTVNLLKEFSKENLDESLQKEIEDILK